MLSDSGDSFGSDSFESLVNFRLIWYTVWRCTAISRDNFSGRAIIGTHFSEQARISKAKKMPFLAISSSCKASSCLKWVFNYKKQEKNSCHMHLKRGWFQFCKKGLHYLCINQITWFALQCCSMTNCMSNNCVWHSSSLLRKFLKLMWTSK